MKFANRIITALCGIQKDKYQHFALGAIIACAAFAVAALFGSAAIAILWSIATVVGAALWKDCAYDATIDPKDIIATIGGGATVWAAAIAAYLIR